MQATDQYAIISGFPLYPHPKLMKSPRRSNRAQPQKGGASLPESRKPSTKELLIDVGERLFGQSGFDGISLREIAAEAGQANSNVVQYHFKDKPGLISAILEERVLGIEQLRHAQLAMLDSDATPDPRQLLKVLWVPLMSITDSNGSHTFCRFMLQYMLHPRLPTHPLAPFYAPFYAVPSALNTADHSLFPHGGKAAGLLLNLHPDLPKPLVYTRISALTKMFLASVVEHDNNAIAGSTTEEFDINPILDMAVAAMAVPAGASNVTSNSSSA